MRWDRAREIARVPVMDRDGALAYLWGDGRDFAILRAPEGVFIARAVKVRDKPLRVQAYRKTLERWRSAGEPILACFEAPSEALSVQELAALVRARQVSWEQFKAWKYYGIGGDQGDDASCRFELRDRHPATASHTKKVYRALHEHVSPEDWQQMLPHFPSDATAALKGDASLNRWVRPVLLLVIAALVLWAGWFAFGLVRGLLG